MTYRSWGWVLTGDGEIIRFDGEETRLIEDAGTILPPDWKLQSSTYGGSIKNVPEPYVRFFPGASRKRRVTARIGKFFGIGVHYFVEVEEEDNPVWNGVLDKYNTRGTWLIAPDDDLRLGRQYVHPPFDDYVSARTWCEEILALHFPTDQYEHGWQTPDKMPRWFYGEGD